MEYFGEEYFYKEIEKTDAYYKTMEKAHDQIEARGYYQTEIIVWLIQKKE